MKIFKNQKGFTLIEILVVIGIIAILAVIVLIAINPARQFAQARDTQRTSNANAILNAVGQYFADHKGVLPTGITTGGGNISNSAINICADLVPTYLPALSNDPDLTTGAMADGQISSAECGGTYDTGYHIIKDADGRVTVSAPLAEMASISFTR